MGLELAPRALLDNDPVNIEVCHIIGWIVDSDTYTYFLFNAPLLK